MFKILLITLIFFIYPFISFAKETVFITGANRGIGYELTKQYLNDGWNVIATSRTPDDDNQLLDLSQEFDSLRIEQLDVTKPIHMTKLAKLLKDIPIDILINNAGILGNPNNQRFGNLDFTSGRDIFDTNTFGPLMVTETFLDNIKLGKIKKIINISSIVGSIDLTRGNLYFYRASKTALNMMMHNLSHNLKEEGLIVGLIHPGVVDTDMSSSFNIKKVSVADSANGIRKTISKYSLKNSGSFLNYKGELLPW